MKSKGFGILNKEINRTVNVLLKNNKKEFIIGYEKHASVSLITAIITSKLTSELYGVYKNFDKTNDFGEHHLMNASYNAVVELYEAWLESGCKIYRNGHHVAQSFSEKFMKEFKYDREKEIIVSY